MAHFFLTGAAGWLGKAVVSRLAEGYPEHDFLRGHLVVDSITAQVLPGDVYPLLLLTTIVPRGSTGSGHDLVVHFASLLRLAAPIQ